MYFSAADEAEFGQQAEHATVVEVGVYPEAACAALPGQCHGAAHEFGRYALSFDLLCDGQTVQDDVWGLVCLLYTSPSPRDRQKSRMPSSA